MISFGVDAGNSLTSIIIIVILIISALIFAFVDKVKSESFSFNLFRGLLIIMMLISIIFLINDFMGNVS